MSRISKRVVDATKSAAKTFFIWDELLPGFGLQVLPSGTRSYVFQYRNREGRSRRIAIAKVGSVTPEQARALAESYSAAVKQGRDPLEERTSAREAVTVGQLLDQYLASAAFASKAATTRATDKGRIARHLRPLLASKPCAKLSPDDVRRAFAAIRDGKTAKAARKLGPRAVSHVRGGAGAARKSIRLLSAVFTWGIGERLIGENPVAGVNVGTDGEREIVLDAPDYERLFATLATMESEHRLRPAVADVVRIIAMTGARRSEIIRLRWRHVDLKAGKIVIPSSSHKTGLKTGRPRIIMLPAAAQKIIAKQPQRGLDDFVFAASKGSGPLIPEKSWRLIRAEAQLPEGIGLHGLRHSLATFLAVGGAEAAQIMTTLGHRQMSTTTRYLHFADKARAALAERAAAPALAGMAAAEGVPKAAVVDLKRPTGARHGT